MNIWPSRTKMEHAKTRAIKIKNGEDKEEADEKHIEIDEFEQLEIDLRNANIKINDYAKDLQRAHLQIKERDDEINRLRKLLDNNSLFQQQIIMELINKPAPAPPKIAAQLYAENKGLNNAVAAATNSNTAGPKGKLP